MPQLLLDPNRGAKYQGEPCGKGHDGLRYVNGGACVACMLAKPRSPNKRKPETARLYWLKVRDIPAVKARKLANARRWKGIPEPTRPEPEACEACGGTRHKIGLNADHDHKTGRFRGWLCSSCNRALGYLGDAEIGVLRLLAYVRRKS